MNIKYEIIQYFGDWSMVATTECDRNNSFECSELGPQWHMLGYTINSTCGTNISVHLDSRANQTESDQTQQRVLSRHTKTCATIVYKKIKIKSPRRSIVHQQYIHLPKSYCCVHIWCFSRCLCSLHCQNINNETEIKNHTIKMFKRVN